MRPRKLVASAADVPQNYFQALDLESVFPRSAPLEVDLGCGDGSFLVALAKQNPQRNFLGLERLLGRVRSACQKSHTEISATHACFESKAPMPSRICCRQILFLFFICSFPIPWPKRRHQRRRIVTTEFLEAIHRALAPDGLFVIATDEREYFEEIQRRSEGMRKFAEKPISDFVLPATTFEKHFLERDLEIYRLVLRKVSPVR